MITNQKLYVLCYVKQAVITKRYSQYDCNDSFYDNLERNFDCFIPCSIAVNPRIIPADKTAIEPLL